MSRRLLLILLPLLALLAPGFAAEPARKFTPETYAALGSGFAQTTRLPDLGWSEVEVDAFIDGLRAAIRGRPYAADRRVDELQSAINQRLQELAAAEEQAKLARLSQPGGLEAYMKEVAQKLKLEIADSGLAYSVMSPGGTNRPAPEDSVVVSWQVTGADLHTEYPALAVNHARIKVSELIPGLAEGLQMMTKDGQAIFVVPPALSFASGPWPPGPPRGQPLVFTVKLHEFSAGP